MAEVGRPQGADTPDGRARSCPECGRRAEVEWPSSHFPDPHAECTAPEECGWTGSLSETTVSAGTVAPPDALALIDELIGVLDFLETVVPGRVASRAMWESWHARRAALAFGGTAAPTDEQVADALREWHDLTANQRATWDRLRPRWSLAAFIGHHLRAALAARTPQPAQDLAEQWRRHVAEHGMQPTVLPAQPAPDGEETR